MLPFKTIIKISDTLSTPKYLQISNQIIKNITGGIIAPGSKLPGSRALSELLKVNRRTVIAAYEEIEAQGWTVSIPNKGSYVLDKLPDIKPRKLAKKLPQREIKTSGFYFENSHEEQDTYKPNSKFIKVDDGYPDVSLAPLKELGRNFSYIMNSSMSKSLMNYKQAYKGDLVLREELAKHLSQTRSINVTVENIMITRGSLMAFYLLFKSILKQGEIVAVGYPGFNEGYQTILSAGGKIEYVSVDSEGININELEELCAKKLIKAVFVISHHHYPTTVSLSASRRMQLLALAEKFKFAIIEDDYDYDFHYASSPLLPIASYDFNGHTCYVGSFSKTIAPSLRVGFIVATEDIIQKVSFLSRSVDSYGNSAIERAIAMLFQSGYINRHLNKALKLYKKRRDFFCSNLKNELQDKVDFTIPEGGLAVWVNFDSSYSYDVLKQVLLNNHLLITSKLSFAHKEYNLPSTRIGFASRNEKQLQQLITSIKKSLSS